MYPARPNSSGVTEVRVWSQLSSQVWSQRLGSELSLAQSDEFVAIGRAGSSSLEARRPLQETNVVISAAGTLVGLIAILVEELESAGSLSRDQITRRLEAFLRGRDGRQLSDRREGDSIETEIVAELLSVLMKPAVAPFRPTVVGGNSSES